MSFNGSEYNYFGVRDKNNIYVDPEGEERDGAGSSYPLGPAVHGSRNGSPRTGLGSAGQGAAGGADPWAFNPVTSSEGPAAANSGYVPVEPEKASQIAFPKIYQKKDIPSDTLGAIYNSSAGPNRPAPTVPAVNVNTHANRTSRGK